MAQRSMRRALLDVCALALGLCGACSKPRLDPVLASGTNTLDAEVLQLIESKVAAVRAAPSDAQAHADLALVYEANELFDASAQSYAQALVLDPSRTIWLFHRALDLRGSGKREAALELLREVAGRMPDSPAVQQRLGQWLLDTGDADGARAAFERALALRPEQPGFLTGLAYVELAREHWREALALARRALKGAPRYRPARFAEGQALQGLGRSEDAKAPLAAGVDAKVLWYPDELSHDFEAYRIGTVALSSQASSSLQEGDFARALELYDTLVRRKPEDPDLLRSLGGCLTEVGQLERAQEVLDKALALAPQSYAVHLERSNLLMRQNRIADARLEAERAVELGGSLGRTHHQLGAVLLQQQDFEGARRELEAAVALDVYDARIFLELTNATSKLGQLEPARRWCRRALELEPNSVPGRGLQGLLAIAAQDFEEARSALGVLERVAPGDSRTGLLRSELQKARH